MELELLLVAVIIIVCVVFRRVSGKLGFPMLLAFMLLGMVFGSDGLFKIEFSDYKTAEQVGSFALIFIIFYGGFGTKWSEARPVAAKAVLLSTLGVLLTSAVTGLFCVFVLGFDVIDGFLIGSMIGSTDAASVFSILRSKRLSLKHNTASLLELESGSNDPASYMLTVIMLALKGSGVSAGEVVYMVFAQIVYAVAIAAALSFATLWLLRKSKISSSGFDSVFILGVAMLSYALAAIIGGNGYLSAYIVGIVLGNSKSISNKKALVNFFDGITGLMQICLFFLLGLLSFPSIIPQVFLQALLVFLCLTLISRPAAVFAIMTPFRSSVRQQLLVSWTGLRGAASIVFAVMAISRLTSDGMDASAGQQLFHIVFVVVLLSILFQGSLIPLVSRKLDMIDKEGNVMKTFTDYADEVPVQFIRCNITKGHPWQNRTLSDLKRDLPPDILLVLIIRGENKIVPRGQTMLEEGDVAVVSARSMGGVEGINLTEKYIEKNDEWVNKSIADINKDDKNRLFILIKRGEKVVIPKGGTIVMAGDVLVISNADE